VTAAVVTGSAANPSEDSLSSVNLRLFVYNVLSKAVHVKRIGKT
jgi:hypothetical protein